MLYLNEVELTISCFEVTVSDGYLFWLALRTVGYCIRRFPVILSRIQNVNSVLSIRSAIYLGLRIGLMPFETNEVTYRLRKPWLTN